MAAIVNNLGLIAADRETSGGRVALPGIPRHGTQRLGDKHSTSLRTDQPLPRLCWNRADTGKRRPCSGRGFESWSRRSGRTTRSSRPARSAWLGCTWRATSRRRPSRSPAMRFAYAGASTRGGLARRRAQSVLGEALTALARYDEAEPLLVNAKAFSRTVPETGPGSECDPRPTRRAVRGLGPAGESRALPNCGGQE